MTAVGALSAIAASANGQVLFSVRDQGPSSLNPRLIYERTGTGTPAVVGGGPGMGMLSPMDQLDDFGGVIPPDELDISALRFIVCFSVDPITVGEPPPPFRVPLPPHNVFDQAQKRQQPGDLFGSTEAYHRITGRLPSGPGAPGMGLFNNVLLRNQSKNYFGDKDFDLKPVVDPTVTVPVGTPLDDVDGSAMRDGSGALPKAYYTLSSTSPSLSLLGGASGSDIFFDFNITAPGSESVFARFEQIGLRVGDDIDGLSVCDDNLNGVFDGTDQVLFSLKRGSPTLSTLGASAADIFSFRAGGTLQIFETATNLGLRPGDNIDTLKMDPLIDNSALATLMAKLPPPASAAPLGIGFATLGGRRRP